ncbi:MAG: hypothetical protein IJJ45_05205 [Clostridia bacterium]|nr:hypothetical protein [Clostridia bacterium]
MKYLMIENAAILLCTGIGFISGIRYLKNQKTLYASMIVMGVGCILLGRLYQCVRLWTGGTLTDDFQVGILGTIGAFSFFFSSNYGQFDSLVDNGNKAFAKYRLISLIAPALVAAAFVELLLSPASPAFKISSGIAFTMIGAACYYHLKHFLIPDADFGIVRCLRRFNAAALCLAVMSMLELVALANDSEWLLIVAGIGLSATTLLLVPIMDRGVKAWRA